MEISGEDDDSLLLQNHQALNDDVATFNPSYFSCSPLHFPRSNPPGHFLFSLSLSLSLFASFARFCCQLNAIIFHFADEKAKNPSLSSNVDKEIIINNAVNKSELTKLSLEPQKMKRKKKAGGYNLRKSLAWDHAFFTEEGIIPFFHFICIFLLVLLLKQ